MLRKFYITHQLMNKQKNKNSAHFQIKYFRSQSNKIFILLTQGQAFKQIEPYFCKLENSDRIYNTIIIFAQNRSVIPPKQMNELPIVILSKQLKYSLAAQKVKTLEKAIQLLPKLPQGEDNKKKTIQGLVDKYNQYKISVASQFNKMGGTQVTHTQDLMTGSTQQILVNAIKTTDPFYQFMFSKCICEIFGPKGSGKTCILLHFAQQYAIALKQSSKKGKILLLNCVSGMTYKRMERLQGLKQQGVNIECLQIGFIQQLIKVLDRVRGEQRQDVSRKLMIGIDMMIVLLMTKQKSKLFISKIFKILSQLVQKQGTTVMFTNFVQHKFQVGNQQLYNHASYYSQSMAQYLTYKLYLQRPDKSSAGKFKFTNIKGKKMEGYFGIDVTGLSDVQFVRSQD